MTTGEKIRELRIAKGWSQEDLATKCGYSGKSVISKTESSGNDISTKKIMKIADALGVPPSFLVEWEKKIYSPDKEKLINIIDKSDDYTIFQLLAYAEFLTKRR